MTKLTDRKTWRQIENGRYNGQKDRQVENGLTERELTYRLIDRWTDKWMKKTDK